MIYDYLNELSLFVYETPSGFVLGKELGLESLFLEITDSDDSLTKFVLTNEGRKTDDKYLSYIENIERVISLYSNSICYFPTKNYPYVSSSYKRELDGEVLDVEIELKNKIYLYSEYILNGNGHILRKSLELPTDLDLRHRIAFFDSKDFSNDKKEINLNNNVVQLNKTDRSF